jgi:hypothetical protein
MHTLSKKILALQRRLAWRARAVAASWTVAAIVAAAIGLGLVDYIFRFSDVGLRWIATATLAMVAGWAVHRWWIAPTKRRPGLLGVARRVEQTFPQLRDELASAVEFLEQSDEEEAVAGSPQLRRIIVAEAEAAIDDLPLETVVDRRPLRRAAACGAAVLLAAGLCLAINPQAVGTALARLIWPLGETEWPRVHYLEFRKAPRRLAMGETFEAELIDRSGTLPADVVIQYRSDANGKRESYSEPMTHVGDVLVGRRENVRHSFAFRAEGGDDRSMRWIDVEVVEPPGLEEFSMTVHPPTYSGLRPAKAERYLEALAGSGIEMVGTANEALSAASIVLASGRMIEGTLTDGRAGDLRRRFRIPPDQWLATESGPFELRLQSARNVSGTALTGQLRVVPDAPPTVEWRRPAEDLFVIKWTVVPVELIVKDDLAVRTVELLIERDEAAADRPGQGGTDDVQRAELFRGPATAATAAGESRTVTHSWPLGPLELSPGAQFTLRASASDYRPGTGNTATGRRLTIISIEQLDARLSERQSQIVRLLERALSAERSTREEIKKVEIQLRDAGTMTEDDRNVLQRAEVNQRQVGATLGEPGQGARAALESLLGELAMNRVESRELEQSIRGLSATLAELAAGHLTTAEREITAARKIAEAATDDGPMPTLSAAQAGEMSRLLATAGAAQEQVIAALERLIAELSQRADLGRFVRELTQLQADQVAHEKSTRTEIGITTRPLELAELTRQQRTNLNKAASGQEAIAARYEKIEQGLAKLAVDLDLVDAALSNRLKEAVGFARRAAIAAQMRGAARQLAENRVGRALELEAQISADLARLLDALRNRDPQGNQRLDALRNAERDLAALRQQASALRDAAARAEGANRAASERQRLGQQQDSLRQDAERLAQQLSRADAADAAQSTQSAADRLNTRRPADNSVGAQPAPGTPEQLAAAERDLERAARQLAEQRVQAELDLALAFIERFRAGLEEMITRQKAVLAGAIEIDAARQAAANQSDAAGDKLVELSVEERKLVEQAVALRELLFDLGAVRVSLEDAERRLAAAADLLAGGQSGPAAQQAVQNALTRLEAMRTAFAQTAEEAQPKPNGGNAQAGNQGGPPQRRPAFELLEVKLLRLLQAELNERTQQHEQRLAETEQPVADEKQAKFKREAQELAAEQERLAELVREMLSRNNKARQDE